MLVDAAKEGDVEIPYFCYEPKLGNPVGACRMCLVEIEGIPKLQTSCSTPVKDGMVVHTQTDRVRHAQNAIVEFLLVNHPLDCPVCDKGGECPLQDITFGWGLGRSRFIEPKRHFEKPLALSPLIAIDRERCILCYRCVRFSQEIAEDYQLIFAERGAHTFVSHARRPPVRGAVQRQHHRAVPGRRADLAAVPVPGAAVGHRGRRRDLHAVPVAVQRRVHRPRREGPARAGARPGAAPAAAREAIPTSTTAGCATRAASPTRRSTSTSGSRTPLVRDGGDLRPVSWERALEAAAGLARHKGRVGALVGGQATNEEGFLLARLMREGLDSPDIDSRAGEAIPLQTARALAAPALQATVPDLEFAHTVLVLGCEPLDDAPILDLRIRKGVRRRGVQLVVATARPSALDVNAKQVIRYAPGGEAAFLAELAAALAEATPARTRAARSPSCCATAARTS